MVFFQYSLEDVGAADKSSDELRLGVVVYIRGGRDLFESTVVHHHHPVAQFQRLPLVMSDQDGGDFQLALQLLRIHT